MTGRYETLVTAEELQGHLEDPEWVVCDVRYELGDPQAGRRKYETGHIPGAVFVDMNQDLAAPAHPERGRHPLPDPSRLASRMGELGIGPKTQVVAYDDASGTWASRLWWLLKYLGHDEVAILDGGIQAWNGGLASVTEPPRTPRTFVPRVRGEMVADVEEVLSAIGDPRRLIVDSRAPDRYRGENETIDPVGGRIRGAKNRFFKSNIGADGHLRPSHELRKEIDELIGKRDPVDVIVYCGSGVTACANLVALAHAGVNGARLYPGSWSEWCSDPSRPIESGE